MPANRGRYTTAFANQIIANSSNTVITVETVADFLEVMELSQENFLIMTFVLWKKLPLEPRLTPFETLFWKLVKIEFFCRVFED